MLFPMPNDAMPTQRLEEKLAYSELDRTMAAKDLCQRLEGYWHVGSRLEALQRHNKTKRDHARTKYVDGFNYMAISTLKGDCITVADILGMPPMEKMNDKDAEFTDPASGKYATDPYLRLQALNLETPFTKGMLVINTLWGQLLLDRWGFPPCPVELDKDGKDAVKRLRVRIKGWEKKEAERESAAYDESDANDNHIFDRFLLKQWVTERKVTFEKYSNASSVKQGSDAVAGPHAEWRGQVQNLTQRVHPDPYVFDDTCMSVSELMQRLLAENQQRIEKAAGAPPAENASSYEPRYNSDGMEEVD